MYLGRAGTLTAGGGRSQGTGGSALGAVLCASIRATPGSRFHTRVEGRDGSQAWAAVIDRLRFRAEMERDCSWWNPAVPRRDEARILEHEQR